MRARVSACLTLPVSALLLVGCENSRPVDVPGIGASSTTVSPARAPSTQIATLIRLPSLNGGPSEARAVSNAGTVIAGYAGAPGGGTRAVRWTLQANGSWVITALPRSATATGAIAHAANPGGDVAGGDWSSTTSHVVLWPAAGGFTVLGCSDSGEGYGMSADAQVVVGIYRVPQPGTHAAVWRPGACREDLPPLVAGAWSQALAVNGDGTIVGGISGLSASGSGFPARWKQVAGAWQPEQLDQRPGGVHAANAAGDLAGLVTVPCALPEGCKRAFIWYAAGGSRELGTLGGADSYAYGINASGEVVGASTPASGTNTGFFRSESLGMVQLPIDHRAKWAAAFAVSDVRPDGTRLAVGSDSRGMPVAWVVRNP